MGFSIAEAFRLCSALVYMDHVVITDPKNEYKHYNFIEICMVVCVSVCTHYGKGYSFSI